MVSGHRVCQDCQNTRAVNVLHRIRLRFHGTEEWRMANIGRVSLPFVGRGTGHLDRLPTGVAIKHGTVFLMEHFGADLGHGLGNLLAGRPDILQINRFPVATYAQRIFGQINLHVTCQRIGNHQWRRSQPVGFYQRVDTPFKVTVTGQHSAYGKIPFLDRLLNRLGQRARVTNTGRTTVANQVKAQLLQIRRQFGAVKVFGHHLGTRCQ
ncbi:hypothetical protein D3C75_891970 [compost metagenome]